MPSEQTATLLNSGRAFFPALISAIEQARISVALESYIFDFNGVGEQVALALCAAAQRGVRVQVLVDGIGTPPLTVLWREKFASSGVSFMHYKPLGRIGLLIPSRWRRLHRKLCVIDHRVAFCGGINIVDDWYDPNYGAMTAPRLDFALQLTGPVVQAIAFHMAQLWRVANSKRAILGDAAMSDFGRISERKGLIRAIKVPRWLSYLARRNRLGHVSKQADQSTHQLLLRDNWRNRRTIERAYLSAIAGAKADITLANAYFLPSKALRLALIRAAKRGVSVRLLLQGRYEYFMPFHATRAVYLSLLTAGVQIFEYTPSFLHAKVAVVDAYGPYPWTTVGSSNLDPLSLLLAKEANVAVTGSEIAMRLHVSLDEAITHHAYQVQLTEWGRTTIWQQFLSTLAYAVMRAILFVTGKRY